MMQKYCIVLAKERNRRISGAIFKSELSKGLLCKTYLYCIQWYPWQGFKAKTTTTNIETLTITKWIVSVTPMLCNYYKLPYDDFKGCDIFFFCYIFFHTHSCVLCFWRILFCFFCFSFIYKHFQEQCR